MHILLEVLPSLPGATIRSEDPFEHRDTAFDSSPKAPQLLVWSQIVTSPRLLRPRSYSLQFRILYFFLYWRLTRLDFAATMTLPSDLYDGLDPTPAASVLAYTDSCTNANTWS